MKTSPTVDRKQPAVPSSAQRVLLVERSAVVRRLVAAHLRRAGYVVVEARDGTEALESFRNQPVQVVITDVGMLAAR